MINTTRYRAFLSRYILALTVLLLVGSHRAAAQAKDYQVKAVFLFHFTQFVDWPATAFSSPGAPFVIGIYGADPFGEFIDKAVSNEKVAGRAIVVKRFRNVGELSGCHLLFINHASPKDALQAVEGKAVLTVGDDINFTKDGGMIQFVTESSKIKLQIRHSVAKTAGLTISSKLLRLAKIVD